MNVNLIVLNTYYIKVLNTIKPTLFDFSTGIMNYASKKFRITLASIKLCLDLRHIGCSH